MYIKAGGSAVKTKVWLFAGVFIIAWIAAFSTTDALGQDEPDASSVIERVEVRSNRRLSDAQILARVRSRAGQTFDPEVAGEDADRIARLKGVDWAYYSFEEVNGQLVLIFVVGERLQIHSIAFEGDQSFRSGRLLRELPFEPGDFLEPVDAEAARRTLEDFYREKGYAFIDIDLDRDKLEDGVIFFDIDEGTRVRIADVKFEGNEQISDRRLRTALRDTRKRRWFLFPRYFVEAKLEDDIVRLQEAYEKAGHLNTYVEAQKQFSEDRKRVYLTYTIEEGRVYTVGEISITGNEFFTDEQLQDKTQLGQGDIFTSMRATRDLRAVRSAYLEKGFVDAEIDQRRVFVTDEIVDVTYSIQEGRRFRIGQINISGNEQTQDKVVRRILNEKSFFPGQWYDADAARGDGSGYLERLIQRQAMMESATITPLETDEEELRDADVRVVEGQTGMVMLGAGIASDTGVIGQVMFEQRNFDITDWPTSFRQFITGQAFKGAGQNLRISLMPGTRFSEYSVSFTEPYLLDRPISFSVDGASYRRWRESHDEARLSGRLGLEKRYETALRRNIGFRIEEVDIKDIEPQAPPEIFDVAGEHTIAGIKYGIGWDTTDFDISPTEGRRIRTSYEQVFGDFSFGILEGSYRHYWPVYEDLGGRRTVLAGRISGSTIVGNAPPFERFYAGGQGSIRGFAFRGVSPRSGPANDPIGSDWMVTGGTELITPLPPENLAGLVFVDGGAVDTGGLRLAAGVGLQLELPQLLGPAPIRFELGFPIMREDEDKTRPFSFSMGTLF